MKSGRAGSGLYATDGDPALSGIPVGRGAARPAARAALGGRAGVA